MKKPWEMVAPTEEETPQKENTAPKPWEMVTGSSPTVQRPLVEQMTPAEQTYAREQEELALMRNPQAQKEFAMQPFRMARETAGGFVGAGTKAAYGLGSILPTAATMIGTGDVDKGYQAGKEFLAPLEQTLQSQQEFMSAKPSYISEKAGEYVEPAVEWGEEKTGNTGFFRAGVELLGDAAMLYGGGTVAKSLLKPKTVAGESLAGRTLMGKPGTLREKTPGFEEARAAAKNKTPKPLQDQIKAADRLALTKLDPEMAKYFNPKTPEGEIFKASASVAPWTASAAKTPQALANKMRSTTNAVEVMSKMRDKFTFNRGKKSGPVSGDIPRNLNEALEATQLVADELGTYIDATMRNAGQKVNIAPVIQSLRAFADSGKVSKAMRSTARSQAKHLEEISRGGRLSADDVLAQIKNFNNDVKAYYTGQNFNGDVTMVLNNIAHSLRERLKDSLPEGEKFAKVRRDLGDVLDLQKRITQKLQREMTAAAKQKLSIFDIIGIEKLFRAVQTGEPSLAASAGGSLIVSKALKILNGSERQVKNMFRAGKKKAGDEPYSLFVEDVPPPTTYFDPAVGASVPLKASADPRIPTGQSSGAPYQQGTYYDPAVGSRVQRKP